MTGDWSDEYARTSRVASPRSTPAAVTGLDEWTSPEVGAAAKPGTPAAAAPARAAAPDPMASASQVMTTLGVSPQLPTTPAPAAPDYQAGVQQVSQAPSPQHYLVAQDALARQVTQDLTAAGHTVEPGENAQLVVDGRPYNVGGQQWGQDPLVSMPGPTTNVYNPDTGMSGGDAPPPPAPPPPAPTPGASGPQTNYDEGALSHAWLNAGANRTSADLRAFVQAHPEFGLTILPGKGDKVRLPSGAVRDMLYATDSPQSHAQYYDPAGGGGGGGGGQAVPGPTIVDYNDIWDTLNGYQPGTGDPYTPGTMPDSPTWDYATMLKELEGGAGGTLDQRKARDAEEQQQAALQQDQALQRFGLGAGLGDSPWLASERAATARSADQGIIAGRRNLEIQANEAHQTAVKSAVDIVLQGAAERRTRFGLMESLKQAAAQLNLSRDQLIQQYVLAKTGIAIDLKKLTMQNEQFWADLLFRTQSFGAQLGFNYDQLNSQNDQWWWDHSTAGGS